MFNTHAISKLVAGAAVFTFGLALTLTPTANANILLNGDFSQLGQNNPVCGAGPSAALNWSQWTVVPQSYLCTDVEPVGFTHAIRVRTNGGRWPWAAMGNGFGQSFAHPLQCVLSYFEINVVSGEVTGNLVSAAGPFVSFPKFTPSGSWKPYSQVGMNVIGLWFETLDPVGIIPTANPHVAPVNYLVRNVRTLPCLAPTGGVLGVPPEVKDLSQYLSYDPFGEIRNPGGPVMQTRITNTSRVTVNGPVHMLIEGLTPGRSVLNPDGDYLGTPFINLKSGPLAPGQSEDVTIQFDSSSTAAIPSFRVRLVSGAF